jgi:hypothetical protein
MHTGRGDRRLLEFSRGFHRDCQGRSDQCYFDRKALENPKKEPAEDEARDVKIKIVSEGTFAGHIDKNRTGQRW